ncbi:phosphoribosylanthranilate isomerase [Maricaulaceae bacterium EIL42A08]|nr:phosphoribosylanthranilate isomerase [Maricaulaceae bacterium EIL42A08]
MTRTLIKICGMNDAPSVDAAVAAGADYLGFIIFPKSPRHVSPVEAGRLAARKGDAKSVAVLVDPTEPQLGAVVRDMRPDIIQLHGGESPARCLDAHHYAEHGVWKAMGVSTADDLAAADPYRGYVDGFVFDAKPPKDADRPGGLGEAWDYGLLDGFEAGAPWMLAGGLTPETVAEAIRQSGAEGVDVVSGVESAPGVKDIEKIRAFIAAVQSA